MTRKNKTSICLVLICLTSCAKHNSQVKKHQNIPKNEISSDEVMMDILSSTPLKIAKNDKSKKNSNELIAESDHTRGVVQHHSIKYNGS